MFKHEQFCKYIIRPALEAVGLYSESAEQLLLGTACAESKLGTYLHQVGGPALGVFQMEPATHDDLWKSYLAYRPSMEQEIESLLPYRAWGFPDPIIMISDMRYATIMARLLYRRSPEPLPEVDDWYGHAAMWKKVYNTHLGAGTEEKFIESLTQCKVL